MTEDLEGIYRERELQEAIDSATKALREENERLKAGGTYICPHCGLSSPHYHKWLAISDPVDYDRNRWTVQAEGQIHFHFSDSSLKDGARLHAEAACDLLNHLEIRNRERAEKAEADHEITSALATGMQARAERAEAANRALVEALKAILAEPYGCAFCDSGKLRNPAKGHDSDCGFELARATLAACEESKK